MKSKLLHFGLLLTTFVGYLEWGTNQKAFLIETEIEVFSKLFTDPVSVLHPFTLLPLLGQLLLIIALFYRSPKKWLVFTGIGCIAILFLLMLFIGILNGNFKIILSTIPFLMLSVIIILHHRKQPVNS